jgi:hypothetical protein
VIIDGLQFQVDLFIMPLAGYDVVLGTNWMAPLGAITWNLAEGTMAFQHGGQAVCWRGTGPRVSACLHATSAAEPLLDALLDDFQDVFAAPSGLPPEWGRTHRIILKPDAAPVAVRPYRYPAAHKDELEK